MRASQTVLSVNPALKMMGGSSAKKKTSGLNVDYHM